MFFELRQYQIRPGKRDAWVTFMEDVVLPDQLAAGVVIVGSFVSPEDENRYVWIRRFESDAQHAAFNETYYHTAAWKRDLAPRVKELLGCCQGNSRASREDECAILGA